MRTPGECVSLALPHARGQGLCGMQMTLLVPVRHLFMPICNDTY